MITTSAKRVAVIAIIYCIGASIVLVGSVYITSQNKEKFADARDRNSEAQAMQQLATTIEQTLRLSENDRQELSSFFISERDTIHFITRVEELAKKMQVSVETTQLAVIPEKDGVPSRLHIGFEVEGEYGNVVQMLSALETLPYHKFVPEVTVNKTAGGLWLGTVALYVTLQ